LVDLLKKGPAVQESGKRCASPDWTKRYRGPAASKRPCPRRLYLMPTSPAAYHRIAKIAPCAETWPAAKGSAGRAAGVFKRSALAGMLKELGRDDGWALRDRAARHCAPGLFRRQTPPLIPTHVDLDKGGRLRLAYIQTEPHEDPIDGDQPPDHDKKASPGSEPRLVTLDVLGFGRTYEKPNDCYGNEKPSGRRNIANRNFSY